MQSLTEAASAIHPGPGPGRGRWIWLLTGLLTVASLTALGFWVVVFGLHPGQGVVIAAEPTRTVTITQPVTALRIESYGGPIKVTASAGPGPVKVTESLSYDAAGPRPRVADVVAHGLLTLNVPGCVDSDCGVSFSVTVPAGVTVAATSDGGRVDVAGTAATDIDSGGAPVGAVGITGPLSVTSEGGSVLAGTVAGQATVDAGGGNVVVTRVAGPLTVHSKGGDIIVDNAPSAHLDSGGGPVNVTVISGPLTLDTEGGDIQADHLSGTLDADTGGGSLNASINSRGATVVTEGGNATLDFGAAPRSVNVNTDSGNATLTVPSGPYAVSADSGGGSQSVHIPVSSGASSSITVNTTGGDLQIGPA